MAKKKQQKTQAKLNPIEYIKTKARTLPIYKCYINTDWQEKGLAHIIIARQHSNGKFTFGVYVVDTFCKGLDGTTARFNEGIEVLEDYSADYIPQKEEFLTLINIDYVLAHNIIDGAIAFAEEYGYKPQKNFEITQYILEEDTEDIELMEIEFGVDGKPMLIDRTNEEEEINDDLES